MTSDLVIPVRNDVVLRRWNKSDVGSVARTADNRAIRINLHDLFPHPYAFEDAERFLEKACARETFFAIATPGEAIGSVGFSIGTRRCSAFKDGKGIDPLIYARIGPAANRPVSWQATADTIRRLRSRRHSFPRKS
jgi:hypothetical protein